MGSMANPKVVAIPIKGDRVELVETIIVSTPENEAPQAPVVASPDAATVVLATPEPEIVPTISLRDIAQGVLKQFTRERLTALGLALLSVGTLFLVWYLGTKYRFEFYIRFKNVPTPAQVFQQAQVGLSNAF